MSTLSVGLSDQAGVCHIRLVDFVSPPTEVGGKARTPPRIEPGMLAQMTVLGRSRDEAADKARKRRHDAEEEEMKAADRKGRKDAEGHDERRGDSRADAVSAEKMAEMRAELAELREQMKKGRAVRTDSVAISAWHNVAARPNPTMSGMCAESLFVSGGPEGTTVLRMEF